MVKMEIVLFRNHMTLEEQQRWWIEEHAPIARRMPGLRSYVINLATRGEGDAEPEIVGTDELVFDSWEAAQRAYRSPEWRQAREHTRASGAKVLRTWAKEVRIIG